MSLRMQNQGFSLLELSIVLVIIGLVTAGGIAMMLRSVDNTQKKITDFRMAVIQKALLDHRRAFRRLPCPGDPVVAISHANFGVEAANPGRCMGGAPEARFVRTQSVTVSIVSGSPIATTTSTADLVSGLYVANANFSGNSTTILSVDSATQMTMASNATATSASTSLQYNTIAAGAVPVKTLGLSDDFVADGWGRRFNYVVSVPLTAPFAFDNVAISDVRQRIRIVLTGTTDKITNAAYALISYGENGHGGFSRNGSVTLHNAGSVNTDELINCDCNNAAVIQNSILYERIVQRLPTEDSTTRFNNFDDVVVFGTRQDLRSSLE
ncbi:MAG: type II secretion system protein [Alphaproteobacteria bacterium]|nr:type II secretion system protein [Alphaproteobacteria bacterium]